VWNAERIVGFDCCSDPPIPGTSGLRVVGVPHRSRH
jgi:hypothetical protein